MTNTQNNVCYGNRENMENTVRAMCDYIENSDWYKRCQMRDSADLNLAEARQLVAGDNIGAARASCERAARYVFGIYSSEFAVVCGFLDIEVNPAWAKGSF